MAKQPINVTASTLTVDRDTHAGTVITGNRAAGIVFTLPASSGKGDKYAFYVGTTISSNAFKVQVANGTDVIQGTLGISAANGVAGVTAGTTTTSDTISMNGTTTGGIIGSYVELTDVASGFWQVSGNLIASGTVATPFSAAVS